MSLPKIILICKNENIKNKAIECFRNPNSSKEYRNLCLKECYEVNEKVKQSEIIENRSAIYTHIEKYLEPYHVNKY
jgi:hypothetical protein